MHKKLRSKRRGYIETGVFEEGSPLLLDEHALLFRNVQMKNNILATVLSSSYEVISNGILALR